MFERFVVRVVDVVAEAVRLVLVTWAAAAGTYVVGLLLGIGHV